MIANVVPGLLFVFGFLVLGGFLFGYIRKSSRQTHARLQAFAQRTGLRAVERTALGFTWFESFEGEQAGRAVRYWAYSTGSGKSRTQWVAVGVRPAADGGLTFDLGRQGLDTKLMELFGAREIKVGDPAFDAAWFVRTNQPEFFAAALVPQIRERLMTGAPRRLGSRYKLEAGLVQYVEQGTFSGRDEMERLEQQLALLHEFADIAEVFANTNR